MAEALVAWTSASAADAESEYRLRGIAPRPSPAILSGLLERGSRECIGMLGIDGKSSGLALPGCLGAPVALRFGPRVLKRGFHE